MSLSRLHRRLKRLDGAAQLFNDVFTFRRIRLCSLYLLDSPAVKHIHRARCPSGRPDAPPCSVLCELPQCLRVGEAECWAQRDQARVERGEAGCPATRVVVLSWCGGAAGVAFTHPASRWKSARFCFVRFGVRNKNVAFLERPTIRGEI